MVRLILGVIVGFVVWTILWIGSDAVLMRLSPGWYGGHHAELEAAFYNQTPFMSDSLILAIALLRGVLISLVSGFAAALIARENTKAPLALGVLLLLYGIFMQFVLFWNYAPLWYHLTFLLLLVPVTVIGGKLKKQKQSF